MYLQPHQILVQNNIKLARGLILYHNTGSGKTITSLNAMNQFKNRLIIIGTKSSKKAFSDEISKYPLKIPHTFFTFTKIKIILNIEPLFLKNTNVIIDEAHNIRNITKNNKLLWSCLWYCNKILLLTATPYINHICDIFVLINIINKNNNLPITKNKYNKIKLENPKLLDTYLKQSKHTISYYKGTTDLPTFTIKIKYVYFQKKQVKKYKKYIRKILLNKEVDAELGSKWIKKYNLKDAQYELDETIRENAFLAATRQLSNLPKINAICDHIAKKIEQTVIYSNYLENGLYKIKKLLDENNIPNLLISGNVSEQEIKEIVNNYNNGLIKILLLSSSGAESLDLKNTKQLHIIEPHWNNFKIKQVIGRAIRYKSHIDLHPDNRHVNIYRWITKFSQKQYKGLSADECLTRISSQKDKIYKNYIKLLL